MTVLQCFRFSAWPSVALGLTLVLSLILLNLGNFVFDGVETKCWDVFSTGILHKTTCSMQSI